MRYTRGEKELLFKLLDVMTDRCPELSISEFDTPEYRAMLWSMFKKLRLELKGF